MGCSSSKDNEIHKDAPTRPSLAPAGSRATAKSTTTTIAPSQTTATTTATTSASKEERSVSTPRGSVTGRTQEPHDALADDDVFIELVDTRLIGTDTSAVVETAPTSGRPTEGESDSLSYNTPRGDKSTCRCLFRGNAVHLRCSRPDHAARTRAWVAESQSRYSSASSRKPKRAELREKRAAFRDPRVEASKLPLATHEEPLFVLMA